MALAYEIVDEGGGKGWLAARDGLDQGCCAMVGSRNHWPLEDLAGMKAMMEGVGPAPGLVRADLCVPEVEFVAMRVSLSAFEGRDTVGGCVLAFEDAQDMVRRIAKALADNRVAAGDLRYEGLESVHGYGYVDIRDGDGGSTVLGSEGRLTVEMAEEAASVLERTLPRNHLFLDATPEQMAYAAEVVADSVRQGLDVGRLDRGVGGILSGNLRSAQDAGSILVDLVEELRAGESLPSP